jgi:hypothetical protein
MLTSSFTLALAATILAVLAQGRTTHNCCTPDDPSAALDERRLAGAATADPESVIVADVAAMVKRTETSTRT